MSTALVFGAGFGCGAVAVAVLGVILFLRWLDGFWS